MSLTINDLSAELLLNILRYVDPHSLLFTQRLVNRRFQSHAEDVLVNEVLPTLTTSLFVYVDFVPRFDAMSMGVNVELKLEYVSLSRRKRGHSGGSDTVRFAIYSASPPYRRESAIQAWKSAESYGVPSATLRLCLPGHFVVTYGGREWMEFSERTARDDGSLVLHWTRALALYLGKVKRLDDARLKAVTQFPLY